jgi:DNA-damage-inducible protein J
MPNTQIVRAQIDAKLKAEAESILAALGMNASSAIGLFYEQVVRCKGLPFDVAIPNEATRRAMNDIRQGRGLTRYKDTAELREKLTSEQGNS